jgi:hypothetical protein
MTAVIIALSDHDPCSVGLTRINEYNEQYDLYHTHLKVFMILLYKISDEKNICALFYNRQNISDRGGGKGRL